jgi:D-aspartate ligase
LSTATELKPSSLTVARLTALPIVAIGSGVTLAAVLNVLHKAGITAYALAPRGDFVRHSRWYRALPVGTDDPSPEALETCLESLPFSEAVLLPCSDDWLRATIALPGSIAARFPSSTPGKIVETVTDKWKFAQLLNSLRIPHPRTHLLRSVDDLREMPDLYGAILKPLSSVDFASRHGVKGYICENRETALAMLQKLELPIMVQEFIPGPPTEGYFLDGFRDRAGKICALFARRRLRMHPAKLGNSTMITSVPLDEVRPAAFSLEYLLEQVEYRGIFSAEFKFDSRDQTFKLIEINARPWWYVEFAARCGVDVCSMAYRDALEMPVTPILDYEVGRSCVFALNDFRAWRHRDHGQEQSFWALMKSWLHADGTPFHWNDPRPAISYLGRSLSGHLQSRVGRNAPAPAVGFAWPAHR